MSNPHKTDRSVLKGAGPAPQQLVDKAMELVDAAHEALLEALKDRNTRLLKATATAYGIVVDKALLVSGRATSRHETSILRDLPRDELESKAKALRDEVAQVRPIKAV